MSTAVPKFSEFLKTGRREDSITRFYQAENKDLVYEQIRQSCQNEMKGYRPLIVSLAFEESKLWKVVFVPGEYQCT